MEKKHGNRKICRRGKKIDLAINLVCVKWEW